MSKVNELILELDKWTSCMSYNDSYVGEPPGFLKSTIRELAKQTDNNSWISVDVRLPPNEELPNGDWPSVIGLWKEGKLDEGLVQMMVTNTAYFCKNVDNFTHWMHLPELP
jgi:hypothetical protein